MKTIFRGRGKKLKSLGIPRTAKAALKIPRTIKIRIGKSKLGKLFR